MNIRDEIAEIIEPYRLLLVLVLQSDCMNDYEVGEQAKRVEADTRKLTDLILSKIRERLPKKKKHEVWTGEETLYEAVIKYTEKETDAYNDCLDEINKLLRGNKG